MFIGDIWIDGAPTQFYFLFIPPIFSLLIWLIELQNVFYLSIRIIHIIFCWFSLFDIFLLEFLIWSLRDIERILGPKQFRNFLIYNLLIYLPICVVFNVFSKKCLPLGYFYPFSLFVFMIAFIPSKTFFLLISDKLIITLGFILLMMVYFPYPFIPLISAIFGVISWNYDILHLSKCSTEPLEISDDNENNVSRIVFHHHHHHQNPPSNRNNGRNRNRPSVNIYSLNDLIEPLNNNVNDIINLNEENIVRNEDLQQITEMGFEESQARNALLRSRNNVQRAVEILLNNNSNN